MDSFYVIANQLFQFLVMMVCGYWAAHKHILTRENLPVLSDVIIKLLLPMLIFSNAVEQTTRQILFDCRDMLFLSLGIYIGLFILQVVVASALGLKGNKGNIYKASFICSNVGFMGIPLLVAAFPEYGGIYIALYSIIDQVVLWTGGVYLTTPAEKRTSFQFKRFFNPALCAILLAIVLILLGISVPGPLERSLLTVGRAATPMSLIYLGALLYYSNWQIVARTKELYLGILTKMLFFPLVFFYVAGLFCSDVSMVRAATIISALPSMSAIAMLAEANHNYGEYALGMVLLTTVASLVTLSFVSYLIFGGFGIF